MATFTKVYQFAEDIGKKVHDLSTDQLVVALTNVAPTTASAQLSDITEIAYTNCSTRNITTTSFEQTAGVASLILEDLVLTATGGDIAEFQYVVIYNDTSVNDKIIGFIDYGAGVTVTTGNTFTIDFTDLQTLLDIQ